MNDDAVNKVTITIEWPPDKWRGHDEWLEDIAMLTSIALRLGLDTGRSSMDIHREHVE